MPSPRRDVAEDGVLLETKLHPPRARQEWVVRAGLIQYLTSSTAKLILIEAPAGFGKSTLVAQWRASPGESRRFAWVSVDPRDDDPVRLWWHIVHALLRACPGLHARDLLQHLRTQAPDVQDSLLPALVNQLAALSGPVVLVLDDYHSISNPACQEQLAFLVTHLPPMTQIALMTRADPPLPLGRMRAAAELAEVRMNELRFAAAEADKLVRAVCGVRLDESDLAILVERTEGWPAGVYLAALSLRGQPSPSRFVRQFTGDNRFVVEFLAEEVLSSQPTQIQQFLRRTAILDRFTPSLCDAVTGLPDVAGIIATLESENLFLVALDGHRQWFRYHQLFGQVLLSWLMEVEPEIVPTLHARASRWHRRHGSVEEAISHALAAGDDAGAIDVLASNWPRIIGPGLTVVFRASMNQIGADRILASPVAAHCAAWCAAVSGELNSLRFWLSVIEAGEHDGPLPDGMRSLQSSAALLRGLFGFGGIRNMRESATIAADLEADPASPWYVLARTALGAAQYLSSEFDAAAVSLSEALQGDLSMALVRKVAYSVTALVATERGRLVQAQELAHAAREIAADGDLGVAPCSILVYTATGAVAVQQGQLEDARADFAQALRDHGRWLGIIPWAAADAMLRLAAVLDELGDSGAAAGLLGEAWDILRSLPDGAEARLFKIEQLEKRLATRSPPQPSAEALTDREEEVLRLLRGTLSLREIGQELYLSSNTVKTHVRAIYRKLGVSSRREAVVRGRDAGLLLPAVNPAWTRRGQMSCSCRARRTASPR
jgi:LuxR family maltose regulon positive regulatory protein